MGMDGTEGGVRVRSQSDSAQSESVCSLIAVLRIELLLVGREGKAVEFQESCGIPAKHPLQNSQ